MAVLTCLFGVTIFFINSGTLCNMIVKVLHLRVDPKFTGGEIAADFFDDSEDDCGSGSLKYPLSSEFAEGSLDLLRYTVHEPVYNAKWQQTPDYWQMDLEFRGGPAHVRNVMIYLGLLEEENPKIEKLAASTVPLFDLAENVEFAEDKPWNFAVRLGGKQGKVYDAKGDFICNAELGFENDGKTVKFRIPLKEKKLQRVYTARETYHYVQVGAYLHVPEVYDILGDNSQLAGCNEDKLSKVIVKPVVADMKAVSNHNEDEDNQFISHVLNKLSEFEQGAENNSGSSESERSGEYFGFETLDQALSHFEKQVKENPEAAVPMAYYGSCLAMKGGQSNVVQAVALVNKAFEYMDRAVELCKNDDERVEVLMNRASVCKSVPEAVFNKALIGAEDYTKLAVIQKSAMKQGGLLEDEHEKYTLAYLYINGSQCYKTAGKETESKILLQEAKKALE